MASALRDEIIANFGRFEAQWPKELVDAQQLLAAAAAHFQQSYVRISSIQAWRTSVVMGQLDEDAEAFFFEAQNDFLTSHCLARCGSFRQALKALRSAIENVYSALFYMDHRVELQKWLLGKHKLSFAELHGYFESHPAMTETGQASLSTLRAEYSTLSKAVHGSAKVFRMTQDLTQIRLWGDDVPSVGKWSTRERVAVLHLNVILAHVFRDKLTGAQNRNLRETMGLVVPKLLQADLKKNLAITLINP